jgi:hypothetical protein
MLFEDFNYSFFNQYIIMVDPDADYKDISEKDYPDGFIPLPAPKDSKKSDKDADEIQKKDGEGKQLTEKDVEYSL